MSLSLTLFGAPTVTLGGQVHPLPAERRSQLVVHLALRRTWVGRSELAALLWPELDAHHAGVNLRKTLHRLSLVPWAPPLEARTGALRLLADTDVATFDAAWAASQMAPVLALGQRDLLAGFDDDSNPAWSAWLAFERERLRRAWREAVLRRLEADVDADLDGATAIEWTHRLLALDALDEAALAAQVRWLSRSGQSARAHQVRRDFTDRLQQDLGVAPGDTLAAVPDPLAQASRAAALPLTAVVDEGFVGREAEQRQVADLLARADCRLVTVLGPGGVGKTRLAQHLLAELAPQFPDGVALIALEDVSAGAELGARLARDLGVSLTGGGDVLDQVMRALGARRMLLVLDNFEQLAGDAARVEQLLRGCSGLKLIVTSRVRLGQPSEWLCPLDGLPHPEPEDADRLESFDAARLFVAAARRVDAGLVAAAEADAIAEICRLVDGLPLALELAAGWARLLSCTAIAAELRQGPGLLRSTDAGRPVRHASIERVFEQSWQLLAPPERVVLARLAVFRGGCSVDAARQVTGATLHQLAALADRSLLRKQGQRLSLHPLMQQMVAAHPEAAAALQTAAGPHAEWFLRQLEQQRVALGHGERDALHHVDVEFENVREAWRWAIVQQRADLLAAAAESLTQFCEHRSRLDEGQALLQLALAPSPGPQLAPGVQALLQSHLALLEYRMDRYADAQDRAERALSAARPLGVTEAEVQCLRVLGSCAMRQGRGEQARQFFLRALEVAPPEVDPQSAADMQHNLAVVASEMGQVAEAMRLAALATAQHHRLGDFAGEASGLQVLGVCHLRLGELAAAQEHLKAGLALAERHGLVSSRAYALGALVDVARLSGDFDAAEQQARQALELAVETNNRVLQAGLQFDLLHIALHRGDLATARSALAEGMHLAVSLGRPTWQLAGVVWFARILAAQGDRAAASAAIALAIEHPLTRESDRLAHADLQREWGFPAQPAAAIAFDVLTRRLPAAAAVPLVDLLQAADDGGPGAPPGG